MVLDDANEEPKDFEKFKIEVQKVDGTVIHIPSDNTYIDVRIPEANYGVIRYVNVSHIFN